MTSVSMYEDWKMRQPKGKPQGLTTALRVWVMVSTNCTCGREGGLRAGPAPEGSAWMRSEINHPQALHFAGMK